MATATQEVSPDIDPSVPTNGLPKELVVSASWGEIVDESFANGQRFEKRTKYPIINGVHLHTMISESEMARFIKMFPMVPIYIPVTDDEAISAVRTGKQPVEIVTINGARFTVPRGIIVQVYSPIAEVLTNMINPIRTADMRQYIGNENFHPLDGNVPFKL